MAIASASLPIWRATPWRVRWLYLLVLSLPFFGYSILNVGDRGLLRADWVFAGLLVLAFVARGKISIGMTGGFVVVLNLVALFSAINLLNATNAQFVDFFTLYFQLLFMSLLFFAMSSMNVREDQLRTLIRIFLFVSLIVGSYAIYEVIAVNVGMPLIPLQVTNPSVKEIGTGSIILSYSRAASFLAEPGYLASILTPPLVILTFLLLYGRSQEVLFKRVLMNWIVMGILFVAIAVTISFASYGVIASIGLLIIWRFLRRPRVFWRLLFAGGALSLVLIFVMFLTAGSQFKVGGPVTSRFKDVLHGRDASLQVRAARTLVGLQIWREHPVLGVGLNNFGSHSSGFEPPAWYGGWEPLDMPGSMWIGILAELGVIGFFAAAAVWLWMLRRLSRVAGRLVRPADYFSVILIALFYVIMADLIGSLFTHGMAQTQTWFDLGLAGLWLSHWRVREQEKRALVNPKAQ